MENRRVNNSWLAAPISLSSKLIFTNFRRDRQGVHTPEAVYVFNRTYTCCNKGDAARQGIRFSRPLALGRDLDRATHANTFAVSAGGRCLQTYKFPRVAIAGELYVCGRYSSGSSSTTAARLFYEAGPDGNP
jgi:hypothetical protein